MTRYMAKYVFWSAPFEADSYARALERARTEERLKRNMTETPAHNREVVELKISAYGREYLEVEERK